MEINVDHGENVMFVETGLTEMIYQKIVKKKALVFFMFLVGDRHTEAMFSKF